MGDAGLLATSLTFVAGGLAALYVRLRREFDLATTLLTLVIVAGATPLSAVVLQRRFIDAAIFAALAAVVWITTVRPAHWMMRIAVVVASVSLVPFVAPESSIRPTLFSSSNGFLALTPMVYVATLGLLVSSRTHRAECAGALVALSLWPPLQTALAPAVALTGSGLAAVIQYARQRPLVAAAPLVVAAVLWNYWLMVQYTAGTIPKDAPVSFAAMVRQQADVHTRSPYIYPFAAPLNLLAAWRDGIPLERYDALSIEPRRDTFEASFDGRSDRFLLDGWGPIGPHADGPFRTISGDRARLVFPLQPAARGVELIIRASLRGQAAADAEAIIELNGQRVGRLLVSTTGPSEARVRIGAADVGRVLRAGYNRLSIVPSAPARIAIHRLRITPLA